MTIIDCFPPKENAKPQAGCEEIASIIYRLLEIIQEYEEIWMTD